MTIESLAPLAGLLVALVIYPAMRRHFQNNPKNWFATVRPGRLALYVVGGVIAFGVLAGVLAGLLNEAPPPSPTATLSDDPLNLFNDQPAPNLTGDPNDPLDILTPTERDALREKYNY